MLRLNRFRSILTAAAACVAGVLAAAGPAAAAELDQASTLRLQIHGVVTGGCAIGSPGDVDFGDLEQAGKQAELRFGLVCNVPFSMTIAAEHGALTNREFPMGQGPYAGNLPYRFDLAIPVRKPGAAVVRKSFGSAELAGAGQTFSSNGGIATEGMNATVTLGNRGTAAGLLGGDYVETIIVTLSAL